MASAAYVVSVNNQPVSGPARRQKYVRVPLDIQVITTYFRESAKNTKAKSRDIESRTEDRFLLSLVHGNFYFLK